MSTARVGRSSPWLWLGAACLVLLAVLPARADTWKLDQDNTEVRFSWNHLGLSRQSAELRQMYGRLVFSPTDPTRGEVEVTLLLAGLSSGVKALDEALRTPDYFDAGAHPRITFRSTTIVPTGPKTADIAGDLTIKGVTRQVILATTWNFTGEHPLSPFNPVFQGQWVSGFSATTTIRRSEFGLTQALPLISDEIRVDIDAEFTRVQ